MCAGFGQLQRTRAEFSEPIGEPPGEQLAEQAPDADARVEIPGLANLPSVPLVVSNFWTVEGDLHESGKGEDPGLFHFLTQDCRDTSHFVMWAERIGNALAHPETLYG